MATKGHEHDEDHERDHDRRNDTTTDRRQDELVEADSLYARAIGIAEETLGDDHPEVVSLLKNRAMLLKKQVRTFWMSMML